jgi:hypothetical protein
VSATVLYMSMSLDGFIARANNHLTTRSGTGAKPITDDLEKEKQRGKDHPEPEHVARRGMQTPGPTDARSSTSFDGVPRVAGSRSSRRRSPMPFCSWCPGSSRRSSRHWQPEPSPRSTPRFG